MENMSRVNEFYDYLVKKNYLIENKTKNIQVFSQDSVLRKNVHISGNNIIGSAQEISGSNVKTNAHAIENKPKDRQKLPKVPTIGKKTSQIEDISFSRIETISRGNKKKAKTKKDKAKTKAEKAWKIVKPNLNNMVDLYHKNKYKTAAAFVIDALKLIASTISGGVLGALIVLLEHLYEFLTTD